MNASFPATNGSKARVALLEEEKALTRQSDALAQAPSGAAVGPDRQALPRSTPTTAPASLADLFKGRSQLLVYHFMFGPDYKAGCPSCSAIADGFNGFAIHLAHHDVMLWAVSRAPLAKLEAYKQRMGWTFPWASSFGSDFNADFCVSITETAAARGRLRIQLPAGAPLTSRPRPDPSPSSPRRRERTPRPSCASSPA